MAVPIAAGILHPVWGTTVSPPVAGLAMAFSSVSVVASSLFLRLYTPPSLPQPENDGTEMADVGAVSAATLSFFNDEGGAAGISAHRTEK